MTSSNQPSGTPSGPAKPNNPASKPGTQRPPQPSVASPGGATGTPAPKPAGPGTPTTPPQKK